MILKPVLVLIYCFSIFCYSSCASDEKKAIANGMEVAFFNVGQGNCTLVRCPKGPALLVDAGSTWFPGRSEAAKNTFKSNLLRKCSARLKHYLPAQLEKDGIHLNVVVSHGDKDHYSLIQSLVTPLKASKKIRFLLGGSPEDYPSSFQNFVLTVKQVEKIYAADYDKAAEIPPLKCGEASCTILSAKTDTQDTNYKSIVLRLSYEGNSVILTGDAVGKTTDSIIKSLPDLESIILQASHHGAETDDSNGDLWLQKVNPKYVVFSSGERSDYSHPTLTVVERVVKTKSIIAGQPPHNVRFYAEKPLYDYHRTQPNMDTFRTYAAYRSGYLMGCTTSGIYHTGAQGDITFKWGGGPVTTIVERTGNMDPGDEIKKLVLGTLQKKEFLDDLISVNVASLGLNAQELNDFLPLLPLSLISINLSHNDIELTEAHIKTILNDSNKLRELDLKGNRTSLENGRLISQFWNHRGCVFPIIEAEAVEEEATESFPISSSNEESDSNWEREVK